MKTLFAITLLLLVACSHAAPSSNLAAMEAVLSDMSQAELESLMAAQIQETFDKRDNRKDEDKANDKYDVSMAQGYSETMAEIEDLLRAQEDTDTTGSDTDTTGSDDKGGSEVDTLIAMMQDNEEEMNKIAELEAMMHTARLQGWADHLKKVVAVGKKIASNPIVKGLAKHIINKYSPIPIPGISDGSRDRKFASLLAKMQGYDKRDNREERDMEF